MRPFLLPVGAQPRRHRASLTALLLIFSVSSAPVLAQQPIRESASRAARTAAEQASADRRARVLPGAIVASAGALVAVLGATAFRTEKRTSGNTPPTSFAECEALKSNPVYANNRCDALKGPNLAIVGAGVAVAATGLTLMAIRSSHASVQFTPGGVLVTRRVKF